MAEEKTNTPVNGELSGTGNFIHNYIQEDLGENTQRLHTKRISSYRSCKKHMP